MTDDLIEAVAEAIQGALGETYSSPPWKVLSDEMKNRYRRMARAALDAVTATHTIVRCYCGHPHTIVELPQPGK